MASTAHARFDVVAEVCQQQNALLVTESFTLACSEVQLSWTYQTKQPRQYVYLKELPCSVTTP